MRSHRLTLIAAALAATAAVTLARSQTRALEGGAAGRDWPAYGGTVQSTRYSSLRQITRANVGRLTEAWSFDPREGVFTGRFQVNPIVVDGVIYSTTPGGSAIALDGTNGAVKWSWNSGTRGAGRGVTYWSDGTDRRILAGFGRYVYALDAATGRPVTGFGYDGRIDLHADLGRDPDQQGVAFATPGVIYKSLYIVGGRTSESLPASPGDIRAYDVRTGALRWSFHTIPHPGEPGYETWPKDAWTYSGSANNWSGMAVDTERGLVYVPTGSAASDFYGADRVGDNLYANTLLALDAATGRRVWHFQVVRHDIWDRDFPSPPTLVTVRHAGRRIDAVAQATKHGALFLFDRQTGQPLFPIEERSVPASTVEGEVTAATQPFPVKPAPFSRQRLTEDMLTTRTPEAHAWALVQFRAFRSDGQFVPFSVGRETVIFPGFDGGAEWGGSAVDPTTGVIYINANDIPWSSSLRPSTPAASLGRQTYVTQCAACHGDQLEGGSGFPGLQELRARRTPEQVIAVVRTGQGRMPPFSALPEASLRAVVDYVLSGESKETPATPSSPAAAKYAFTGYHKFLDPDGYPAVVPPWGTLNAINLNTGEYAWKVPLGEYPELAAQGVTGTGSENYGGPIVTAGGLLFIGATNFDHKLRAFDKDTGRMLWETTLVNSANSTPATYEVNGTQYIVVAAFGGYPKPTPQRAGGAGAAPAGRGRGAATNPNVGAGEPSGGAFVAFRLGK